MINHKIVVVVIYSLEASLFRFCICILYCAAANPAGRLMRLRRKRNCIDFVHRIVHGTAKLSYLAVWS